MHRHRNKPMKIQIHNFKYKSTSVQICLRNYFASKINFKFCSERIKVPEIINEKEEFFHHPKKIEIPVKTFYYSNVIQSTLDSILT